MTIGRSVNGRRTQRWDAVTGSPTLQSLCPHHPVMDCALPSPSTRMRRHGLSVAQARAGVPSRSGRASPSAPACRAGLSTPPRISAAAKHVACPGSSMRIDPSQSDCEHVACLLRKPTTKELGNDLSREGRDPRPQSTDKAEHSSAVSQPPG